MNYDESIISLLRNSRHFDLEWYREKYLSNNKDIDPIIHYFDQGAAAGFDPSPGFSTLKYLQAYSDVAKIGINPLEHYIKSGLREGRSPTGEITSVKSQSKLSRFGFVEYGNISEWLSYDSYPDYCHSLDVSVCIHLHLFHIDLWPVFRKRLLLVPFPFTLLISIKEIDSDKFTHAVIDKSALSNVESVIIKKVPNRGRDVAPWVVTFREEILAHSLFCHIHSKRSDYNSRYAGWRDYLLHGVLGSTPVIQGFSDLLINSSKNIGIAAPPYFSELPNQPLWGANYELTHSLAKRIDVRLEQLVINSKCPDYPAGSYFWARVDCIKPLLDLGISYDEFPDEKGQIDGTLAHSIERLLGLLPSISGRSFGLVGVDVGFNLINYWDQARYSKAALAPPVNLSNSNEQITKSHDLLSYGRKVAVCTCSTGRFDTLMPMPTLENGIDYFFITDHIFCPNGIPNGYNWLSSRYSDTSPRRTARFVKTHPYYYFDSYDYVVWIDANIVPLRSIGDIVSGVIKSGVDLGMIFHPTRHSWRDEAKECIRIEADDEEIIFEQIARYDDLQIPEEGLIETNFIIANMRSKRVKEFYRLWWNEIDRYSLRDQLSVNYALKYSSASVEPLTSAGKSVRDESGFLVFSHGLKHERKAISSWLL